MSWEKVYPDFQSLKSQAKLTIKSDGWSGHVVNAHSAESANREFQLDVNYTTHGNDGFFPGIEGFVRTLDNNKGSVWYQSQGNVPIIIGISLEHMGELANPTGQPEEGVMQFLGRVISGTSINDAFAWGAKSTDQSLTIGDDWIRISDYEWHSAYNDTDYGEIHNDTYLANVGAGANLCAFYMICNDGGNWPRYHECEITTDLPIFETDADLLEYCQSGGTVTDKILNMEQETPQEAYENDQKYYKLKNLYARGSGSSWTPIKSVNYRIKPIGGKICLYAHTPTEEAPYQWKLYHFGGYDIWSSRGVNFNDDDDYTLIDNPETEFLQDSIKIGTSKWRVNIFDTDIPRWGSKQDADDYINGLKDISECLNYDYIVRTNQEILGPDIGLADPGNDNGSNGMVYSYGSRMYVMSSSHLAGFFTDVFNTANINDILDGTKLFGSSQISAITGVAYFPCNIDEFCTVTSPGTTPRVGSWVCPTATSNGYITKNDKMIDCGGAQLNPIYNDFRDLEPYNLLWVTLPFCGTHQLQLTKYLGKFISFKYSIDAVTGVCTCHIYADDIELDSFDGVCSSSRPITAIDQTQYLSNVIGAVNSGMNAGTGAISSGAQAIAGAMTGNVAGMVGGVAGFGASGAEGVFSAYNIMQAVDNPPMTTRGSASGCQGFFGPTKIHLHFFQKKSVKPLRALELCGAPSNVSGTVAQFSGFLKCRTVKIADGFTGTNDELQEIMQYLKNGIYV